MLCPFATHRLLPANTTQPRIQPTQIIDHSAWDALSTSSLDGWWRNPASRGLESHFYVQRDGGIEQYIDTEVRADANNRANPRAISIEAWDGAASLGRTQPYTPAQVASMIRLHRWLHDVHPAIARRVALQWDAPGVGWHSLFPQWSVGGTECPGPERRAQLNNTIYPATFTVDPEPPATAVRSTMHSFVNAAGRPESYWVAPDGTLRNQWDQPDGTLSPIGQPLGTYALDTAGAPLQIRTGTRAVHWIPAVATLGPTAVTIVVTGTGDGGQTWEPAITADLRRYLKG